MVLTDATRARVSAMGTRAGETFAASGIPVRNPFDQDREPELAQAWRAAYLKAARPSV